MDGRGIADKVFQLTQRAVGPACLVVEERAVVPARCHGVLPVYAVFVGFGPPPEESRHVGVPVERGDEVVGEVLLSLIGIGIGG